MENNKPNRYYFLRLNWGVETTMTSDLNRLLCEDEEVVAVSALEDEILVTVKVNPRLETREPL